MDGCAPMQHATAPAMAPAAAHAVAESEPLRQLRSAWQHSPMTLLTFSSPAAVHGGIFDVIHAGGRPMASDSKAVTM